MTFIAILILYSVVMVALGVFVSRRVRESSEFFVAGRKLTSGLIFSTLLAANIGAGSTVGAAGLGYRDGFSAWWWVGSAGIGSLILAFTVGPRIWRIASEHGLYTVGDYLEFRFDRRIKAVVAILLWFGSLAILAGQLIAIAWILNVTAGISKPLGCAIGATVATTYFATGGLHSAARVNVFQLLIKLVGFGMAFVYLAGLLGRILGHRSAGLSVSGLTSPDSYFSFFGDGITPLKYLVLLVPSFIISPGLLQKIFGARDARAVRIGVGLNAICLLGFAFIPVFLGIMARYEFPNLVNRELALPTLMTESLPVWLGGLLLGAIFSAELSTADAVLFMLSTSLGKDLYKTFLNPEVSDQHLMRVVRAIAIACGVLGALLGALLPDVISALTIFYTLLTAALVLPLLAGLYVKSVSARGALAGMTISVVTTLALDRVTAGAGYGGVPAVILGILAGATAMGAVTLIERLGRR
ncbi:MAG: sodium:solute symporter family protein [Acidobacteriota bacterium]